MVPKMAPYSGSRDLETHLKAFGALTSSVGRCPRHSHWNETIIVQ